MTTLTHQVRMIVSDAKAAASEQAVIQLEYKDAENDFYLGQMVSLDAAHSSYVWTIEVPPPGAANVFYSGILKSCGVETASLPVNVAEGPLIEVGDVPSLRTVAVAPLNIDWARLKEVEVALSQGGARHAAFVFRAGKTGPAFWPFTTEPPSGYEWSAVYKLASGATYTPPAGRGSATVLPVPPLPPSFDLSVGLARDSFSLLPLSEVEITADTGEAEAVKHIFTAENAGEPWKPTVWEQSDCEGNRSGAFVYHYKVSYEAGRFPPFISPAFSEAGRQGIVIDRLGLMAFAAVDIDFAFVRSIKVSYAVDGLPRSFVLTARQPSKLLRAGVDYKISEPVEYALEYDTDFGSYVTGGLSADPVWNPVLSPFTARSVQFYPVGLTENGATVELIELSYRHQESGDGWEISGPSKQAELSAQDPVCQFTFPSVNPARAVVIYEGNVIFKDGNIKPIQKTCISSNVIPVGDTPGWVSVEIDPSEVKWAEFSEVDVTVYCKERTGEIIDRETFGFRRNSLPALWGFFPFNATNTYFWKAIYCVKGGEPVELPERSALGPLLVLPSTPSIRLVRS